MVFHDTPTIAVERDRRRRTLMATIAEFKRSSVVNPKLIIQLVNELEKLGGPIDE